MQTKTICNLAYTNSPFDPEGRRAIFIAGQEKLKKEGFKPIIIGDFYQKK